MQTATVASWVQQQQATGGYKELRAAATVKDGDDDNDDDEEGTNITADTSHSPPVVPDCASVRKGLRQVFTQE
ncbi:hypothetical protein PoB_005647100 [Plakobranchus ocellatus]|uniref:Uncharacterized protein n=1 Tax=Plakobranchus ocellatus TaxID=259542 RepID=A0AAV4C3P5_9GAST|nr:hypothetical protein PoB_005647100 [Plakobranchus ocellatus]